MKITFLGTGAADWKIENRGETAEFRRFCSALINDTLLIDPGPHVFDALEEYGKNPSDIKYIINTHRHLDHYFEDTVNRLAADGAVFFDLQSGDETSIGNYTVRAYKGNHGTCDGTVHFIITEGEKTLFYGLDSAWLLYQEVQAIKNYKPNFAVLDATIGDVDGDYRIFEHNNLGMVIEMKKTLGKYVGSFCISHMARTLHTDHKTLCERMKEHEILVAYDGLEIEI